MKYFLLLPTQLFEKMHLEKEYTYVLWEHPHYFKKYNYNKKKLMLHRGSMQAYLAYLKRHKYKVKYVNYNKSVSFLNKKEYYMFDPIDRIKLPGRPTMYDSPNFLLSSELCEKYRQKTDKFFFNAFYMYMKKELDIIPGVKSQDKNNRQKLTEKARNAIPKPPNNKSDKAYAKSAARYVEKHFKKNYGNTDNFIFPLTRSTAKKWLKDFIKMRFNNFGPFQDHIDNKEETLYHSLLSTSINIGLLNPSDVIKEIMKHKSKIRLNSFEGFIRQLFWREYQRYCYEYCDFKGNYFGNKKSLGKKWYNGTTGIDPIDHCIVKAFDTGYLHHIERLMVVGNYMNISGISPKQGFKWFMEFSCDSYEWVMYQNVYDMVFFVTGGKTMRRPYISSSNYILKMSNWKKGDWSETWTDLYRKFVKKNKKKLHKFMYYIRI